MKRRIVALGFGAVAGVTGCGAGTSASSTSTAVSSTTSISTASAASAVEQIITQCGHDLDAAKSTAPSDLDSVKAAASTASGIYTRCSQELQSVSVPPSVQPDLSALVKSVDQLAYGFTAVSNASDVFVMNDLVSSIATLRAQQTAALDAVERDLGLPVST